MMASLKDSALALRWPAGAHSAFDCTSPIPMLLTKPLFSQQIENQLRLPVSMGDQVSIELCFLEDFAYGCVIQVRPNRLLSLRNDVGQHGHDRTVCSEISRIHLIPPCRWTYDEPRYKPRRRPRDRMPECRAA